ncbi:hypothetical protein H924_00640 [Corynebacterium callunae DSM 20147]|uniref:Uncharacterized protein n=1 Tax=Corynebacterium callunae DSM 20147 TaxID=1121353 RepID=M1TMM9_9CORY|nr:hypothetical protein H924_00640 [Corynebacterium callunae DSM 20147]
MHIINIELGGWNAILLDSGLVAGGRWVLVGLEQQLYTLRVFGGKRRSTSDNRQFPHRASFQSPA